MDVPYPTRLFSLREANALIDTLKDEFTRARELRDQLMAVQEKLAAAGRAIDGPEVEVDSSAPPSVQRLQGHRGKHWTLGEAAYIAFRGPKRISPLFNARSDRDQVLRDAQDKLVSAVNDIEAGRFPPTPDDVFVCSFCSFAAACRKDYVGDV